MIPDIAINDIYYDKFLFNTDRYYVLIGGRGSGKSYAAAQKIITRCLTDTKCRGFHHRFLVVRKTLPALKRSCWQLMTNMLSRLGIKYELNKTEMSIRIGMHSIIFVSFDDPEKIKSIEGITSIWIEEANELSESEFRTLDLCLRGKYPYYKQIILTLNPISELLWINKALCYDINFETQNYVRDIKSDRAVLKTTYRDNKFIDDKYTEVLENLKHQNKNLWRISALGLWGGNSGLIYTGNYDIMIPRDIHWEHKFYGVDFGYNNPSAVVEVMIRDQEYYIRQLLYDTQLTNTDLIKQLNGMAIDKTCKWYCDSAEPDRIEEFKRAGFNASESDKEVNTGISLIQSKKLHIFDTSTDLIKEIRMYCWQEKQNGDYLDKPVKEWDHCMDAMRYAIYTHSKTYKPTSGLVGMFDFQSQPL